MIAVGYLRSEAAEIGGVGLQTVGDSVVTLFAGGLVKDKVAGAAALTQPWSNGQTEGQVTRLKLVKRQTFGHAKLDLLEARLIGAP